MPRVRGRRLRNEDQEAAFSNTAQAEAELLALAAELKCDESRRRGRAISFSVDSKANARDMAAKGRHGRWTKPNNTARGERHWAATVTAGDVARIRRLCAMERRCYSRLAREYGLSPSSIRRIAVGASWRHIPHGAIPKPPVQRVVRTYLTVAQVKRIRVLFAAGAHKEELARRFGVTRQGIHRIVTRLVWRDLAA